jgi:hypothetical protein
VQARTFLVAMPAGLRGRPSIDRWRGVMNVRLAIEYCSRKVPGAIASMLLGAILVPPSPAAANKGIWISDAEIAALPMSGSAWSRLKSTADQSTGTPELSDQEDPVNVQVLAKALVYARTRDQKYRDDVVRALQSVADSGTYSGRALALARELGTYAIAADLISLNTANPSLDTRFRAKIKALSTTATSGGPGDLVACHEDRPNNWGTHCGASRIAIDLYLGDKTDLARAVQVFRGWLGDRSAYAGFEFGDLSWQADSSKPVGVNPKGSIKLGHPIDGVLPDDQRRAGGFQWPPTKENYVYEALQGALAQAHMLSRAGYDVWNWQDKALLRAFQWLHNVDAFPATGDDTWQPHVVNYAYKTNFPAPVPSSPGKAFGWTDWTLSSTPVAGCPKCSDNVQNCTESDVDCGEFCSPCALDKKCGTNADCASGFCSSGLCKQSAQPSCTNGVRDGTETDIDCGGSCSDCANGKNCSAASDCRSNLCQGGKCAAPAGTCSDGTQNQDETDVDCGGRICATCPDGDHCTLARDCESGVCTRNICVNPATGDCTDNLQNQDESDVDCGGVCPDCASGKHCVSNADCTSDFCDRLTCAALPAPVLLDVTPLPTPPK